MGIEAAIDRYLQSMQESALEYLQSGDGLTSHDDMFHGDLQRLLGDPDHCREVLMRLAGLCPYRDRVGDKALGVYQGWLHGRDADEIVIPEYREGHYFAEQSDVTSYDTGEYEYVCEFDAGRYPRIARYIEDNGWKWNAFIDYGHLVYGTSGDSFVYVATPEHRRAARLICHLYT